MTEIPRNNGLPIYMPEQVLQQFSPREVGEMFAILLDEAYEGRSDRIDGHPPEKFQKRIEDGVLYPILVFDKNKPVACYAIQWYGEKVDMGNAAVAPEYRGTGLVSGKEIYAKAHKWVDKNLANKTAIITGGSRIPVSAGIAVNYCGRFPCWLPPFPSWGYNNEPLEENNDRRHEFLLVSEKYPRGCAYAPGTVFLPQDLVVAGQISELWKGFSRWQGEDSTTSFELSQETPKRIGFTYSRGDDERVRFDVAEETGPSLMDLGDVLEHGFAGVDGSEIPTTRGIAIDVPADTPFASNTQDYLLNQGFIFCGIYPGIEPIEVSYPDGSVKTYDRKPTNIYGLLRPGLQKNIQPAEIPQLNDKILQRVFEDIRKAWML